MAHKQLRINKTQATQIGLLSSEAGLAIMDKLLTLQQCPGAAVAGGVPLSYWRSLLANVQPLPGVFSELGVISRLEQQTTAPASHSVTTSGHQKQGISRASVEHSVQQLVMSVLGREEIDPDQPLAYQGMDSLSGLELRQQIHVSVHANQLHAVPWVLFSFRLLTKLLHFCRASLASS